MLAVGPPPLSNLGNLILDAADDDDLVWPHRPRSAHS
jgi:hypothetical protein